MRGLKIAEKASTMSIVPMIGSQICIKYNATRLYRLIVWQEREHVDFVCTLNRYAKSRENLLGDIVNALDLAGFHVIPVSLKDTSEASSKKHLNSTRKLTNPDQ